ncbi:Replication protein A 70 kDa DNA-binding subunit B [Camellia lanceoleosa]|uniref:Replication protein A 70 kDa DNA-binding subunit B n=1 Tax=Camellia lanceoleosa TaxID=1840588 RepID=A0ACC0IHY0_9ERIC|nr:Replication protein A 70 kDa DNA-binding subunit B [Camellia lanceoleosa]
MPRTLPAAHLPRCCSCLTILQQIEGKEHRFLIVIKCEAVSSALESEIKIEQKSVESDIILKPKQEIGIKSESKSAGTGIILKPKQELVAKSMAPSANGNDKKSSSTCFFKPIPRKLDHKSPSYSKGNMRTYKNARGEGCVFNVELTDEDGTQIQATMFNEAAKKFFDKFQLGKVYYISKGTLKVANKEFKTVQNDYEMTLNENSEVEEASNEAAFIPETKFNFAPIDELGPYVNEVGC